MFFQNQSAGEKQTYETPGLNMAISSFIVLYQII